MITLIVDGYNVIHAWPELASLLHTHDLAEARLRLVRRLAEHAAATGDRITVVFDAHDRAPGAQSGERVDGVEVVFGSRDQSADHVIERRVSVAMRAGGGRGVTVATSDRLQRDLVVAMGAAVLSALALRQAVLESASGVGEDRSRRRREAGFADRLEHRLDEATRRRLERLRRGLPLQDE